MKTQELQKVVIVGRKESILIWAEQFMIDRKVRGVSEGTVHFYEDKLNTFFRYCDSQMIQTFDQLDASAVRQYLMWLKDTGHNPGGINACYRTLRAFLIWYSLENEPDGWRNPIDLVKSPKVPTEVLKPIEPEVVIKMMNACEKGTFYGDRDLAMIAILFDTGMRHLELLELEVSDFNTTDRSILIKNGKGGKSRTVYAGSETARILRNWLKHRTDNVEAMWVSDKGNKMTYNSTRHVIRRLAMKIGIDEPGFHEFRRAYAINSLRKGIDIISLQRLMGHSDLSILNRYLKQESGDLKLAHDRTSPLDFIRRK